MVVLGVCGFPAGGKSTVAGSVARLGAARVDADAIARNVLDQPPIIEQLLRQFGTAIRRPDGKIDRPRLAEIVFGDDESARTALRCLESIVHPETRAEIVHQIHSAMVENRPVIVLDIPLLFESGWDVWCDEIWFVETPWPVVVESARRRGWDERNLGRRIARQLSADEKRRLSTSQMLNQGSLGDLDCRIESWWSENIGPMSSAS